MTDQRHHHHLVVVDDPIPDEPRTELGYARRFCLVVGDRVRYVPAWRQWLVWDGRRWAVDVTHLHRRWMGLVARSVTTSALARGQTDPAVREARRGESNGAVTGALALAAVEPGIAVDVAELDADPYLLNCHNGTLDLRTFELHPHDPNDLLTKLTGASLDPAAPGPTWYRFLAEVQPEEDMRAYLARLLGHTLEGQVVEHLLPVFSGTGANGKSTLLAAVESALGDYALTAAPGLLSARTFDAHPTEIADLFGVRLALLHETDEGRHLAEGTVKRLTGGDIIRARRMRQDFWSFKPSHTFVLLTNHEPLIAGTDEGIWRRLRLVPFSVVIPEDERDERLGQQLELERAAVLAWLVSGYEEWRETGLADPDEVLNATAEYRRRSDAVGRFLEDRCNVGPMLSERSTALFAQWQRWCVSEGVEPGSQTAFSLTLKNRGYAIVKANVKRVQGVELKPADSEVGS